MTAPSAVELEARCHDRMVMPANITGTTATGASWAAAIARRVTGSDNSPVIVPSAR